MKTLLSILVLFLNLSAYAESIPLWIGKWSQPAIILTAQPTVVELIWMSENQIELRQVQWQNNEFVFRAKPQILNLQDFKILHQGKVIGEWTQSDFYIETQDRGVKYFLRILANETTALFEHLIQFSETQTRSNQVELIRISEKY